MIIIFYFAGDGNFPLATQQSKQLSAHVKL